MTEFQGAASEQGRQFADQCDSLLVRKGFVLREKVRLDGIGVEIDREALSPSGRIVWFEYKGSVAGSRPGLRRTDTLKKAIANGALLKSLDDHPPYLILTSHLPETGAGFAMLDAARALDYFHDVICIYDTSQTPRLDQL